MILFIRGRVLDVRAVTFSLTGTLYPQTAEQLRHLPLCARHYRFLMRLRSVREDLRGRGRVGDFTTQQIRGLAGTLGVSIATAGSMLEDIVRQRWWCTAAHVEPFSGVRELLDALAARDVRLGVISDGFAKEKLERLGLSAYPWRVIATPETTGAMKPHPALFREAQQRLEVPASKILHVGSQVALDVVGAHRAGFCSALKETGVVGQLVHMATHVSPKLPPLTLLPRLEIEPPGPANEELPDLTFYTFGELLARMVLERG